MLDFKQVYENGDYEVFRSTNHADPDRIAMIVVEHGFEDYPTMYAALIEDQYEEQVTDPDREFFKTFDEAKRYLETKVVHTMPRGKKIS